MAAPERPAADEAGRPVPWRHVPALDGVRGFAVVVVLLFHGGVSWARGGFLGVDAFFVLSGLLITSLLLEEASATGRIDLGRFWSRRLRRLLPALLVVVAVAGAYGLLVAPRGSLMGLRRDAVASLFYVSNWRYISAGSNYFEATAAPSVLRHTWSLAIEEQFYLAWPLVLVAATRLRRTGIATATAVVAGLGTLASAIAMALIFDPGEETSRAYFGTDTRVQVVLTGAVLAALLSAHRRRGGAPVGARAARALGLGAAAAAVGFCAAAATLEGTEAPLFRGGFLAVALAVAVVLAHIVLVPDGWSARAMSWAPLRSIGLVSYGLYLWHWPVFLTLTSARTGLTGPALLAAKVAVSGVLAVASYHLVERPIRTGALPGLQATVAATGAMAMAAAAVLVGTTPPSSATRSTVLAARTASGFPISSRPARPPGQPVRVLVVGDSIAKTLAQRFERPAAKAGLAIVNRGVLGCGVVRGGPFRYFGKQLEVPRNCEDWPRQWGEHVGRHDPDVVLVTVGRWEVMDRFHDGRWTGLGDPVFDRYLDQELERAVDILSAGDAIVAFTTAPYFLRGERPDGGRWPEDETTRVDRFNAILRGVVARRAEKAAILDLNAQTSRDGRYTPVVDGVELRFDGVHFSPAGAAWLAPWFFSALQEMAPPTVGGAPRATTTTSPADVPATERLPATTVARPVSTTTSAPRATTTTAPATTTTADPEPPPPTTAPPSSTTTMRPPVPTLPTG